MWTQDYTGLFIYSFIYKKQLPSKILLYTQNIKTFEYYIIRLIIYLFLKIFSKFLTILPNKNINNYITGELPNT